MGQKVRNRFKLSLLCFTFGISLFANNFAWQKTTHLSGPQVGADYFKGKVILVEFWGINCPPCIAAMPHLDQINKKYASTGKFAMVASHVQGNSKKVSAYLNKNKFSFPVYQQFRPAGPSFRGIPHTYVYDHTGKFVANGNPHAMIKLLPKLIEAVPAPGCLIAGLDLKYFKSYEKTLVRGKSIKLPMANLKRFASGSDARATEAKMIYDHVNNYIDEKFNDIEKLSSTKPSLAYKKLAAFSKTIYGMPQAQKFRPVLDKFKEYKYLKIMVQLRETYDKLADGRQNKDLLIRKLNALVKREDASELIKAEAQELLSSLG